MAFLSSTYWLLNKLIRQLSCLKILISFGSTNLSYLIRKNTPFDINSKPKFFVVFLSQIFTPTHSSLTSSTHVFLLTYSTLIKKGTHCVKLKMTSDRFILPLFFPFSFVLFYLFCLFFSCHGTCSRVHSSRFLLFSLW